MICRQCGSEINDGAVFCGKCGAKVEPYKNEIEIEKEQITDTSPKSQLLRAVADGLGMNWYKFVIYFRIFFAMFSGILSGILYISGYIYDIAYSALGYSQSGLAEFVYNQLPALSVIDKLYGFFMIVVAIYMFYARQKLAKFKTKAPMYYIAGISATFVLNILYIVISLVFLGEVDFTNFATIITSGVAIILEFIYFRKRDYLFVNE